MDSESRNRPPIHPNHFPQPQKSRGPYKNEKQSKRSTKAHFLWSALILLALLAVCAIPFALGQRSKQFHQPQNVRSPIIQQKKSESAVEDPWHGSPVVRIAPAAIPGPLNYQAFENPAPVARSLLPSVNVVINNNTGGLAGSQFTQSETSVVSFGSTRHCRLQRFRLLRREQQSFYRLVALD
jgi:hypothetical protein